MEKHSIKQVPIVQNNLVVGIVSRANLQQALASAADDRETAGTDRVLRQRIVDGIKDQPWAHRSFNVIVKDHHADLWGFVFSKDEKAAIRVAAEATPGIESVTDNLRVMPSTAGVK